MINFNSGWQAYVEKGPADFQVRLYFLRLIDNQNVEIARPLENGEWLMSKANEGLDLKPSLVLHYGMWEALVKEVSKEPSPEKSAVEAELGATKFHLEDMRRLVFPKEINA